MDPACGYSQHCVEDMFIAKSLAKAMETSEFHANLESSTYSNSSISNDIVFD